MPFRLDDTDGPAVVVLELPAVAEAASAVESELRMRAVGDRDHCCGYFPALAGQAGILADLAACQEFAARLPQIIRPAAIYRFNFLRLSLVQQSAAPAYHLDSDADTAISGDLAMVRSKRVLRLLLNLSTCSERTLHYLDVDPWAVGLSSQGSYLCAARPADLCRYARVMSIPVRRGSTVHGVAFTSNAVLHSGVDDLDGHFVAAYGTDAVAA